MRLKYIYPDGACLGTTKKGKRCTLRDVYANMRCKYHGGTGEMLRVKLRKEKLQRKIKRTLARSRRFSRFLNKVVKKHPNLQELADSINAKNRSEDLARMGQLERLTPKSAEGEAPNVRSENPQGNTVPVQEALPAR